jgi:AcrR family transcriptional regulator
MPKISSEAYQERRASIVAAARRCFIRNGINISVDEICAEAKVSKGALYGYFPSKDAVIQAIADEHVADLEAVRSAASCKELVAALVERLSNGDRAANGLELEAWAYALKREELRNRLLENTVELRLAIESALVRMRSSNHAKSARPDGLLLETFAMGLVAKAALGRDEPVEDILSSMLEVLTGSKRV